MNINQHIIQACLDKDPRGYRDFYQQSLPYVYSVVRTYIFDEEYRKDVVQDVFAQAFNSLTKYDDTKSSINTWIARIAINRSITFLRDHYKLKYAFNLELVQPSQYIEEANIHDLTKEDLENILLHMPMGYKTIFLLNVIDGYSHVEISDMLDISQENSRSQLSRAIKWIKTHIFNNSSQLSYEFK
jgi:RNA polymerase sigma factor (sigma-70 family)